jgi:hypothetical protein
MNVEVVEERNRVLFARSLAYVRQLDVVEMPADELAGCYAHVHVFEHLGDCCGVTGSSLFG